MSFIKKHRSNILFVLLIGLLFIPQTGRPIKVWINRVISFSPSVNDSENRDRLTDYSWALLQHNGQEVNLKEFRGKKILINYWATWCPPCIAEMPGMQTLYDDYKDSVVFLFVTSDEAEVVKTFMDKRGFDLPVFSAQSSPPDLLEATSLPTTYLIDKNGDILIRKVGSADWNSDVVRQVLNR